VKIGDTNGPQQSMVVGKGKTCLVHRLRRKRKKREKNENPPATKGGQRGQLGNTYVQKRREGNGATLVEDREVVGYKSQSLGSTNINSIGEEYRREEKKKLEKVGETQFQQRKYRGRVTTWVKTVVIRPQTPTTRRKGGVGGVGEALLKKKRHIRIRKRVGGNVQWGCART